MTNMVQKRFEAQLEPILDKAYRMAYNMAGNPDDARDIVQESALRAFRAYHTFQEGTNFKAWFYRIVTNFFLEWTRKRRRESLLGNEQDVDRMYLAGDLPQLAHMNPVASVLGKMEIEQVHSAINALPEEYSVVASLYFVDELSYQEIADIVECPVGTVRSRLHRGRKLLMRSLRFIAEQQGILPTAACA